MYVFWLKATRATGLDPDRDLQKAAEAAGQGPTLLGLQSCMCEMPSL